MSKIVFSILALLVMTHANAWAAGSGYEDKFTGIKKHSLDFETRIRKSCGLSIRFDMSDFMAFNDELEDYSTHGLEHAQHLVNVIEDACRKREDNKAKLKPVTAIFIKRGSMDERRMLLDKNKNIVYLAANDAKNPSADHETLQRQDLVSLLKISFTAQPVVPAQTTAVTKREDAQKLRDQKIKDAAAWLQTEMAKVTAIQPPPADLVKRFEVIQQKYKEKVDAAMQGR